MHALSRIHRSLRVDGLLLDIHPQPEHTRMEVWRSGMVEPVGPMDDDEDIRDIRQARARLRLVERRGYFVTVQQRRIDLLEHYPSVEDWLERRAWEGSSSLIPEGMIDTIHRSLAAGDGEIVKREPIRASLLRRLPAV